MDNKAVAIEIKEELDSLPKEAPVFYNAITYHRNTEGAEMKFDNRPEAIWLYKIIHKYHNVVIQKCSQVGITELLFNVMMYWLQKGIRVLFLVPNDEWRHVYVSDRVNGLIKNVPYYADHQKTDPKDPTSTTLKSFFGTTIKFAGARNITNLFSYPCKAIIVDEFDLCNQENMIFAEDRTGWRTKEEDDDPYTIKVGNPSIENWGINKQFKECNQCFWFAQCDHCGHNQIMHWLTHFVEKDDSKEGWKLKDTDGNPVCVNCHKAFNRRGKGQYKRVSKGKEGSISIHVDKLRWDVSKDAIQKLFTKWIKAQTSIIDLEHFYNQELGLPYDAGEHRITKTMLMKCAENGPTQFMDASLLKGSTYTGEDGRKHRAAADSLVTTVAGVDQGQAKGSHMHISIVTDKGVRHKLFIGRIYSIQELEQKLDDYNVEICVIDSQGGGFGFNELRELCQRRSGQVYLCRYRPKDKAENLFSIDDDNNMIQANRTASLDGSYDAYKNQKVVLPQCLYDIDKGEFVNQMVEPIRQTQVDKDVVVTNWINSGADDHRHADNYELLAQHVAGYSAADMYDEEELNTDIIEDAENSSWDVFK